MTHAEFCYWLAFNAMSPIGEEREDLRAGIVAAETHNANSNITKKKDMRKPTDFMPFYKAPPELTFDRDAFFKNLNKFAVRKP